MKRAPVLAIAAALVLAPTAHAVSCGEVRTLNGYVRDDFQYITGEAIDRTHYQAIYTLNGARACSLDLAYDSIYVCEWTYPTQAAADAAFARQSASLTKCLAGWSPTMRAGLTAFDGAGDNAKLRWSAQRLPPADAASAWRVTVSLSYMWSGRAP